MVRHFLSIVFGALFTVAAAWSIGRVLFTRLRIQLRRTEHELLAGVTGAAILSLIVFALCATHLVWIPVFWAIGFAALGLNWKFSLSPSEAQTNPLPRVWKWIVGIPFAFYALFYLSNSLAPENSPDGQAYHLAIVYRYFREHGFERVTTNMYENLSHGMEMLFLFAFSFGRHAAAATVHCCCLFALPLMIFCYAHRIGRSVAGACAAMIFYLSPLAGIDGTSAYNDVALATTAFATFYLVELWREDKRPALLIPIGLIAGFCFAIKYTGYAAIVYVFAIVAWELVIHRPRERAVPSFAILAATVTLMIVPWLIKDWLWVGNPVSPFFNRIFPNPYIHVSFEDSYRLFFRTYDLPSLKPLFWMDTVKGQLGGLIGPIFLLSPIALLSARTREGRHLLLAALFFLLPYPQNLAARFLLPALPFVSLGIALAFEFSRPLQAAMVLVAAVLAWPKVIYTYCAPAGGWQLVHMPWKAALGIIPQDTYLKENSPGWITVRMIDEFVPPGKRVWSTTALAEAYSTSDILVNYYSAEGERIQDILYTPTMPIYQPTWNLRYTFTPQAMTHVRFIQNAGGAPDIWSIGEMRFFLGTQEIRPEKTWKLEASSFPWDIGLAFDGNPLTRWRSWEPIHPGMYVDVDFGRPVNLDRIELHCSHDQWKIDVALQGIDAKREKLEDEPFADADALRRLATATVKARGIDYLLISGDSWLAKEMQGTPERWGLRKVSARGTDVLLQIQ